MSLPLFRPELAICATIVVMLLVRLFNVGQKLDPFWLALAGSIAAFWFALPEGGLGKLGDVGRHEIFTGMLVYDSLTVYFRMFLLAFAFWFIILVRMTGLADKRRRAGFLHAAVRRDARHVPDGVGQPFDDGVPRASRWRACRRTCWPASSRAAGGPARRR